MAAGGAMFTDGPDIGSIGIAAGGAWLGGGFGEYAPGIVNSITGKDAPGLIFDTIGSLGTEFLGGYTKDLLKTSPLKKPLKKKRMLINDRVYKIIPLLLFFLHNILFYFGVWRFVHYIH